MLGPQQPLYVLPAGVETRWLNPENPTIARGAAAVTQGGRKGAPCYGAVAPGQTLTLADYSGSAGVIRHIWTTIQQRDPEMLRGLRMDFYWDGEQRPAISAPWGDLFGMGLGRIAPFQSALFTSPEGRNFNCYVPMPFRKGFRVTVTNETGREQSMFWMQIDLTLGDELGDDAMYFHAFWNRQPLSPRERVDPPKAGPGEGLRVDYEILPHIRGAGRYLGANFGVRADTETYFGSWWGEGEVKVYLDGDRDLPTLAGTGTEDYIGSAWGQGLYDHLYQGCHFADAENLRYCFYRYHVPDPVYFRTDARVTIQQIGCGGPDDMRRLRDAGRELLALGPEGKPIDLDEVVARNGWQLFERADDWSSCAYFYLDRPANDLPELPGVERRTADLD